MTMIPKPVSQRLRKAQKKIRELKQLLRDVEWYQATYNGSPSCPCCGNQEHWGHTEDCELAKHIKP